MADTRHMSAAASAKIDGSFCNEHFQDSTIIGIRCPVRILPRAVRPCSPLGGDKGWVLSLCAGLLPQSISGLDRALYPTEGLQCVAQVVRRSPDRALGPIESRVQRSRIRRDAPRRTSRGKPAVVCGNRPIPRSDGGPKWVRFSETNPFANTAANDTSSCK